MILAFAAPFVYVLARQTFVLGSNKFSIRDESGKVIGHGRILLRMWAQDDQGYESNYSVSVPKDSPLQASCFDGAKQKCTVKISETQWYVELSPNPYITTRFGLAAKMNTRSNCGMSSTVMIHR